ncbi:putative purine-cytosine permease [Leucosporidium creatinivorum]|uniref:Putative purine-cytosine permease n=1 Tax=Leucosporidium creatinivorum TaxID=106004 RepID=A0A1Y2FCW5_9BASI|nr:putative purine-cytosine permease [Leucosporidium creatinivorum]
MSTISEQKYDSDIEKGAPATAGSTSVSPVANGGVDTEHGILGQMWKVVLWADAFGVEARGIERVPEDERHHAGLFDSGFLWFSANMTVATLSLGTLGSSIWEMGLTDSLLTIIFFNLLTTLPVALFATWGMQTGLRQMVIGRYSFGTVGVYFPVVLNCIACLGWAVINTIVGASALRAVPGAHQIPEAAGIIVIALITLAVALFGYKIVHKFERWAGLPVFIILIILLGQAAPHMVSSISLPGTATAASVLSFGGTVCGFALGWVSYAADYTVNLPADGSVLKVFLSTYIGLNIPLIFVECIGAGLMSTFQNKTTWEEAYNLNGIGGLISGPLSAMGGFGSFLLVVLALSICANNVPNMYSFSLSFQVFGSYAQAVPRMFLVILGTIIYIVLSLVGYSHFEAWLETLLTVLSYWLAIYCVILLEEHYLFRGGRFSNYNLVGYNNPAVLPKGYAALLASGCGIAGAVLGMSQTWYVGKIGLLVGPPPYGGDIGFELSGSFAAVTYPLFRYLEKQYYKR